ncbi:DUF2170 family protein [Halomonas sediminis]
MDVNNSPTPLDAKVLFDIVNDTSSSVLTELAWPEGDVTLDVDNNTLVWELSDYGNLAITLSRSENEWVAMTPIAPVASVKEQATFNEILLRQGLILPLASIGITDIGGHAYYVAYGQLFGDSKLESLCAELHATAGAAMEVAGLIQEHFA